MCSPIPGKAKTSRSITVEVIYIYLLKNAIFNLEKWEIDIHSTYIFCRYSVHWKNLTCPTRMATAIPVLEADAPSWNEAARSVASGCPGPCQPRVQMHRHCLTMLVCWSSPMHSCSRRSPTMVVGVRFHQYLN